MKLSLVVLTLFLFVAAAQALLGGWTPIKDVNDNHVKEIADFAISEHNKQANAVQLTLSSVMKGATQVVAGVNYKLVVEAKDASGKVGKFEVIVWEKSWEKFMQLTSFKKI